VHKVHKVDKDLEVHRVFKEQQGLQDLLVLKGHLVQKEMVVLQDLPEHRVLLEL